MIEFFDILARAGGGGSSGGGGAAGIIAIPVLIIAAIISWHKRKKKIQKAKADLQTALQADSTWSSESITKRATDVFYAFQRDWSNFDTKSMQTYLKPDYLSHMYLVMVALHQLGRKNTMENVMIKKTALLGVHDNDDDELDSFDIEINANATDMLVDTVANKVIHTSVPYFVELWHFEREGNEWDLSSISQKNSTTLISSYDNPIDKKFLSFATENNFFYNADFGWLLLPLHGTLFSAAKFGKSDINHHVIGKHGERVVQFFEYVPDPRGKTTASSIIKNWFTRKKQMKEAKYTVGQITLPKNYGNIMVEKRGFFDIIGLSYTPKNMQKMSYAPAAFGKKFNVYASDEEQVTSFELLHPAYLEKLVKLKFEVNIEVVGDNLYLYSSDVKANYNELLELLKNAYKELER